MRAEQYGISNFLLPEIPRSKVWEDGSYEDAHSIVSSMRRIICSPYDSSVALQWQKGSIERAQSGYVTQGSAAALSLPLITHHNSKPGSFWIPAPLIVMSQGSSQTHRPTMHVPYIIICLGVLHTFYILTSLSKCLSGIRRIWTSSHTCQQWATETQGSLSFPGNGAWTSKVLVARSC